jgi:hypothetical protein
MRGLTVTPAAACSCRCVLSSVRSISAKQEGAHDVPAEGATCVALRNTNSYRGDVLLRALDVAKSWPRTVRLPS